MTGPDARTAKGGYYMLRALLRPALWRKFGATVRHEGMRHAVQKARQYCAMVCNRRGRSAVPALVPATPDTGGHYLQGTWRTLAQAGAFHISQSPAIQTRQRKIALIGDLNLPQCRKYRVEQLAEFWRNRNVEVVYAHYQDVPRCVHALQDATHLMEYRLTRTTETAMYRYEARRLRLPILYDLDDPLFSVSAYETYSNMQIVGPAVQAQLVAQAPGYLEMMNSADVVSVSTPALARHAALYCPRPIYLRRNFADQTTLDAGAQAMARAAPARSEAAADFRVVFASGSHGHEADFDTIRDQVATFLDAADNRSLTVLGHFDTAHLPAPLRARVRVQGFGGYRAYLNALAQADCAIMPLADDLFNRCKSGVRVLDAAAVGVPAIVGPVSDMAKVVQHGKTGIIVDGTPPWNTALTQLADAPETARDMGRAARQTLEARWIGHAMPHVIAPELIDWVEA